MPDSESFTASASWAGVIFVWWNNQISPGSIDITAVLYLLVIAVIGGLNRLEGAWIGAFVFVVVSSYAQDISVLRGVGLTQERFETLIGLIFLVIVLLSPDGLLGIWDWIRTAIARAIWQDRKPASAWSAILLATSRQRMPTDCR